MLVHCRIIETTFDIFFLSVAMAFAQNVLLMRTIQITNANNAMITMIDIPSGFPKNPSFFSATGASKR